MWPYLDYCRVAKWLGMSDEQYDKIHYDCLGKVGCVIVKCWVCDITVSVVV